MSTAVLRSEFLGMKGDLPPQAVEQLKLSREYAAKTGFFNNTVWTVGPVVAALIHCVCAAVIHVFNGIRDVILYPSYLFDRDTPVTVWNTPAHVLRILVCGGHPLVEKLTDATFCLVTGSAIATVVVAFSIFGQGAEAHRLLGTQKFKNNDPVTLRAKLDAEKALQLAMQNKRKEGQETLMRVQAALIRAQADFKGGMEEKDRELGHRARMLQQKTNRVTELEILAFPGLAQFREFKTALTMFPCEQNLESVAANEFLARLEEKIMDPSLDFNPTVAKFIQAYNVLYPLYQGAGGQQAYILEQLNFLHPFTQNLDPWNALMARNPRRI